MGLGVYRCVLCVFPTWPQAPVWPLGWLGPALPSPTLVSKGLKARRSRLGRAGLSPAASWQWWSQYEIPLQKKRKKKMQVWVFVFNNPTKKVVWLARFYQGGTWPNWKGIFGSRIILKHSLILWVTAKWHMFTCTQQNINKKNWEASRVRYLSEPVTHIMHGLWF